MEVPTTDGKDDIDSERASERERERARARENERALALTLARVRAQERETGADWKGLERDRRRE